MSSLDELLASLRTTLERTPFVSEQAYFAANPQVAGMMTPDNRVILNQSQDIGQDAVAKNEMTRLALKNYQPQSQLSPQQEQQFAGTAYANDRTNALRSIMARIASRDPSANATFQQDTEFRKLSQPGGLIQSNLMDIASEQEFQSGIRSTPWFKEFVQQYGEEPDLDTKDYDYRKAWAAGIRPTRSKHDGGRFHWSSSLDDGTMLKSEDHPTAWKEHFMRATGKDPDDVGVTKEQWLEMRNK